MTTILESFNFFESCQHIYNNTKRKIKFKLFINGYYSVLIATIKF
ncbi:hypothetical protein HNQ00_002043 [Flavobacterium sp. 14A]|nr:hypothetical protein [Flavobacterium sp. 14A]